MLPLSCLRKPRRSTRADARFGLGGGFTRDAAYLRESGCAAHEAASQVEGAYRRMALVASALMLLASFALLAGASYAWFTDSITIKGNVIKAKESFVPDANPHAEDAEQEGVDGALVNPDAQTEPDASSDPHEGAPGASTDASQPTSGLGPDEVAEDSSSNGSLTSPEGPGEEPGGSEPVPSSDGGIEAGGT